MRVNQLDGEIAPIKERNSKDKRKNGKLVQGHDESKGYTKLGRNPHVRKDLTRERYRIREDYTGYKQTFYQKGCQVETKMVEESNAKEDTWLKSPCNDTEHYKIMSSTETVLSSNDSVTDMYEKNYKYFAVRKSSLSEESPVAASEWQHNLKLDSIRSNQNDVNDAFRENRRIVRLPKTHRMSEPLNGNKHTEENASTEKHPLAERNALTEDAKEEKHKKDNPVVYMPNHVYLERSNVVVPEKNSISNFNPLVHVSNIHYYYNPCERQNCNDNHFSYDCPYNGRNRSFRYGCHPFCEPHDGKCLHAADHVSPNKDNFYMNKKYSLEIDNYMKGMYFTNRSYIEKELRKKWSHYFRPLKRPFRGEGSNRGAIASDGLLRKRESGSSGGLGSGMSGEFSFGLSVDPVDRLNGQSHAQWAEHQTRSHTLRKGRKCKGEEYHRRKNADHEGPSCPSKKNLFSQFLKNLKLLGYALFFCFFMSNENKAIKEKQNSRRGWKKAFSHSSYLKSERKRK
ncbi:hypothetical protein C922_03165 [Plasmodium inui San Antonio 1]|uniref:Uncharacterized protein n=1 Tax=Plasmodium inui San Antonio 1 TaxID=1237626 RepID=W7AMM3_9APIC|nr:hypothetical protein C922_03165 [Plasmodium inui San Antonio 1]EUD66531.1 hypothetical protein C922_03165 [Plasmodium inui San Antonio 1]